MSPYAQSYSNFEVTTPKLPPPPRSAQNRSGCSFHHPQSAVHLEKIVLEVRLKSESILLVGSVDVHRQDGTPTVRRRRHGP
ncbi:hypothetical protein C8039_03390 [Halogeometricum sp. wsp3]|nr:hypothetical protein C8039_03390 [Halogeometricum sp. wsp3]